MLGTRGGTGMAWLHQSAGPGRAVLTVGPQPQVTSLPQTIVSPRNGHCRSRSPSHAAWPPPPNPSAPPSLPVPGHLTATGHCVPMARLPHQVTSPPCTTASPRQAHHRRSPHCSVPPTRALLHGCHIPGHVPAAQLQIRGQSDPILGQQHPADGYNSSGDPGWTPQDAPSVRRGYSSLGQGLGDRHLIAGRPPRRATFGSAGRGKGTKPRGGSGDGGGGCGGGGGCSGCGGCGSVRRFLCKG